MAGKLTPISPEVPFDVDSYRVDRTKTRILYQLNEGGFTRLHAIDAKTYKPITLPKLPDADHVSAGPALPSSTRASFHSFRSSSS